MKIAILSATIAFIAAMVAQGVSHRFTLKREKKKYNKEILQEFILPYFSDVILYIETETAFRKGHDVEAGIQPDKIIKSLSEKVSYANKDVLTALIEYRNSITYFDGRGEAKNLAVLRVFYLFLDYSKEVLRESEFADQNLFEKIEKNMKLYGLSYILTDSIGWENTVNVLIYKWVWGHNFYDKVQLHILKEVVNEKNIEVINCTHKKTHLIAIMESEYNSSSLRDMEFLFECLHEAKVNFNKL